MFDHYLDQSRPDLQRPIRVSIAVLVTLSALAASSATMWVAQKLNIDRVAAPSASLEVFQFDEVPPPEPPTPPPPIAEAEVLAADSHDATASRREILEDSTLTRAPASLPSRESGEAGPTIGLPLSQGIPGLPGLTGIGGPGTPGLPVLTGGGRGRDGGLGPSAPIKPLAAVMSQAIYSPDPDHRKLMTTQTARADKRTGESVVQFCVGVDGKVVKARTTKPFPKDPEVDRICRDTVKSWRFRPFLVGGRAIEVCSTQTFAVQFE